MGGRGTFAIGKQAEFRYKTVGSIDGVKILKEISGKHNRLPEEAHSSSAYIRLKPDGTFHEMRFYDKDHYLVKEIAYHPEPDLVKNKKDKGKCVLHVHDYPERDNFGKRDPRPIKKEEYLKYKHFFKGVPEIDQW